MTYAIALNYDRRSPSVDDLKDWLSVPIQEIRTTTERILSRCLDLALEDIRYAN